MLTNNIANRPAQIALKTPATESFGDDIPLGNQCVRPCVDRKVEFIDEYDLRHMVSLSLATLLHAQIKGLQQLFEMGPQ